MQNNIEGVEEWREIKGYSGYLINKNGVVKNKNTSKVLARLSNQQGSFSVALKKKDGRATMKFLHKILAETFLDNPDKHSFVGFKDGNKENVTLDNIYWLKSRWDMDGEMIARSHTKKEKKERKQRRVQVEFFGTDIKLHRDYYLTNGNNLQDASHRQIIAKRSKRKAWYVTIDGLSTPLAVLVLATRTQSFGKYVMFKDCDLANHDVTNLVWVSTVDERNYDRVLYNPWWDLIEVDLMNELKSLDQDIRVKINRRGEVYYSLVPLEYKMIGSRENREVAVEIGKNTKMVAMLVARAFIDKDINYGDITFIDGIKTNVNLNNLFIKKSEPEDINILKDDATGLKINQGVYVCKFFSKNGNEILKLSENGDIFVHGRLIENDREVTNAMKVFLREQGLLR